jgi:hypothetical protein
MNTATAKGVIMKKLNHFNALIKLLLSNLSANCPPKTENNTNGSIKSANIMVTKTDFIMSGSESE